MLRPQGSSLFVLLGPVLATLSCQMDYERLSGVSVQANGDGLAGAPGTDGLPGTGGISPGGGGAGSGGAGSGGAGSGGAASGGAGSGGAGSGGAASGGAASGGAASGGAGSGGAGSGGAASGGAASGGAGSGGAGSGGGSTLFDPMDGYFVLDAEDTGGQFWDPSTLVFTSVVTNPDSTLSLGYRIDWFENTTFGLLLAGEEYGIGTYDPATALLALDQTSGFSSNVLDHYEATYDAGAAALQNGTWNTGTPGTFTGQRTLAGVLLPPPVAQASSTRSTLVADFMVDADMMTYWSSANGEAVGVTVLLTLNSPSRLRGLRILSVPGSTDAAPAVLRASSRDATDTEIDLTDLVMPADPMWKPLPLVVDTPVSSILLEVMAIAPTNGNRVVLTGVEVFGAP